MEEFLLQLGYPGLFIMAFLAATILPISSEIFVALMTVSGYSTIPILLTASLGNFLGASTNYFAGKYGNDFILSRFIKVNPKTQKRTEFLYKKYGSPFLFFSFLPIVGDPMCIIPGIFHLNFRTFTFWVFTGRALRYIFVIKIAETVISG